MKIRHIIPQIIADVTGHERYMPEIVWSQKSYTHNFFRLIELVCGRRKGVRIEMATRVFADNNGKQFIQREFYTFESVVAHIESLIRGLVPKFSFSQVYIPQLSVAGSGHNAFIPGPYLFAIAHDADATATSDAVQNKSWSHTCTGSDLVLMLSVSKNNGASALGTNTYNGVAFSAGADTGESASNDRAWVRYLEDPATGANTVVCNLASSGFYSNGYATMSFTGASTIGGTAAGTGSGTSLSKTPTVVGAAGYVVDSAAMNAQGVASATGGQTVVLNNRINNRPNSISYLAHSGSNVAMTWSNTVSGSWSHAAVEVQEATGTAFIPRVFIIN